MFTKENDFKANTEMQFFIILHLDMVGMIFTFHIMVRIGFWILRRLGEECVNHIVPNCFSLLQVIRQRPRESLFDTGPGKNFTGPQLNQ
jgi:hypothetical protein